MTVPAGFLWGVAIASHQNEGGAPESDWTLAEQSGRYPHRSGEGTRFRDHMEADLDLVAKDLGGNALRLSAEWARVEPRPGEWDMAEVAYLHRVLDAARERGLAVILTLHHFTSPQWLHEGPKPGWEDPRTAEAFERYAGFLAHELRGKVAYYLTLNEPTNLIAGAYVAGMMPPFRKSLLAAYRAVKVMRDAHERAYTAIHAADPDARVSLTEFSAVFPLGPLPPFMYTPMRYLAWLSRRPVSMDYVGLHYYGDVSFEHMGAFPTRPDHFYARPDYFRKVLVATWKTFQLPILVAENGLATRLQEPRNDGWDAPRYLEAHVKAMQDAMAEGVPVLGYLWWTLTDNYEWGTFDTRFGLYQVECLAGDYARVPKPVVATYRRLIAAGGVAT